ncbi:MAG TPA: hypothetical protein VL096_22350 [Pirellulaceae bacterium]|nr:hypothetical protein [Pirellulaceae bacterium]
MSSSDMPWLGNKPPLATEPNVTEPNRWGRIEALLERGSEWLNPILVKEARQALKSQQFVFTFSMLLLFGWLWTLIGVYLSLPGIFYGAAGKGMLYGYFLVLSIPLLVVVPFSAFRSLAAEREDGTYELISITALNARQIVGGKLGSAILQMLVYFSALAPCVAFTYLLRGVDIFSIFFVLYYTFLLSLILSTFALLVATATRARHWQALLSVLLLLLLFIVAISWVFMIWESLNRDWWVADFWQFWAIQAFILTMTISYFVLFLWAAGAQISFASDNRSSRLRYVMLAQQVLWMGWVTFMFIEETELGLLAAAQTVAGLNWMVLGALLIGEHPQLSQRVKRELPQSYLGRMLFTWFNPGSGTGYVFAILNLIGMSLFSCGLLLGAAFWNVPVNGPSGQEEEFVLFTAVLCAYAICYLGISRLMIILARQVASVGLVFSLLINIFFLVAGAVVPYVFQYWLFNYRNEGYTPLQITNWIWSLAEAIDGDLTDHPIVLVGLFSSAFVIFFGNLILAAREIAQVRTAAPQRVLEDEAALHPQTKRKASSPWDDEPSDASLPPGT